MLRRLFPHPYLSLFLVVTWFLLVNQWKLGSLVMAIFLATVIPLFTAPYWQHRPKLLNLPAAIGYFLLVLWDIVLANIQVAKIILFFPQDKIRTTWIAVPVDLKSPEGIAVLAGTITMTPGTVSADMSSCGKVLLIHSLHAPDPGAIRDEIKTRYESRLMRIFG